MTLKDYVDIIRFEMKDNNIPEKYLQTQINLVRREIAYKTRCLECYSECLAEVDVYKYRFPRSSTDTAYVDLVEILTLKYDGVMLEDIAPDEMHYLRENDLTGTPRNFTLIGGKSQPTGFVELWPTPDVSGKTIWIHAIQYPSPLVSMSGVCELQDAIQRIVLNQIVGEYMLKSWRTPGISLINFNKDEIRDHTKLKKW